MNGRKVCYVTAITLIAILIAFTIYALYCIRQAQIEFDKYYAETLKFRQMTDEGWDIDLTGISIGIAGLLDFIALGLLSLLEFYLIMRYITHGPSHKEATTPQPHGYGEVWKK